MTNYIFLENYSSKIGRLGLSKNVFKFIGIKSIKDFRDVLSKDDKNSIHISFRNNVVIYKINLAVKKGTNIHSVKESLTNTINNNLLLVSDQFPVQTNIRLSEKENR